MAKSLYIQISFKEYKTNILYNKCSVHESQIVKYLKYFK